jgi:putative FmdB family regulatory protein
MIYEFKCEDGHISEYYLPVKERDSTQICKSCQKEAKRVISVPKFQLNGADLGFPTAADKWAREHEKAGKLSDW